MLTKSEMEIMDVLWQDGGALSRSDLLARSQEKSWKDSSVHILLNSLLGKNLIREAGSVKRGKTYSRTFLPTVTREQYFASEVFSHRYKPELVKLIAALLENPDITEEALKRIAELVKVKQAKPD